MDFSRNYLVHYYEADSARRLTIPALIQYFEDIAILHSASVGFGLDYFHDHNCGWMLLKWDVKIRTLPKFAETVTVATRVHAMKRFLADREFVMTSAAGEILAEARSNWLFADIVRRRPLRVSDGQYDDFHVSRESESDFISIDDVDPVDPAATDGSTRFTSAIRTSNGDIDTNNHVNNVRYISWALDSLPTEFAAARSPATLRVQYRKELGIGCGAEVLSTVAPDGLASRHTIRNGDGDCCSLEIGWTVRD
jgi:medium-chain acyl-[acyl-carrier-protein] hydrolase